MDIEVVVDLGHAVVLDDEEHVGDEAEQVDGGHQVPLLRRAETGIDHHDEPRSEALVQVEVFPVLHKTLSGSEEANQRNRENLEIVLHLSCVLVDAVKHDNCDSDSKR